MDTHEPLMRTSEHEYPNAKDLSRRDYLKQQLRGLSCLGLMWGYSPDLIAQSSDILREKKNLRLLNKRPLNIEALPHLLDDDITPRSRMFVRNNGHMPPVAHGKDLDKWTLTIDGEVSNRLVLDYKTLRSEFKHYVYHLVLECGGNGRAAFYPKATGNQWSYGAVGCPMWKGVLLRDVLQKAGLKKSAQFVAYYGHDIHLSGNQDKPTISRGVDIAKALDPMTMIAFGMNGGDLPPEHGFPARLICPGYPGSASGKWLRRLWIRDRVHDGPKMGGYSYRVPKNNVRPGTSVNVKDMQIITKMPVKSLITSPRSGTQHTSHKQPFSCRGFAWTGQSIITEVSISIDFGQTWIKTKLSPPKNRYGWQRWQQTFSFPRAGYYEIWARATDNSGTMQPMIVPGWNPKGYLNNAMPRIAIDVMS